MTKADLIISGKKVAEKAVNSVTYASNNIIYSVDEDNNLMQWDQETKHNKKVKEI